MESKKSQNSYLSVKYDNVDTAKYQHINYCVLFVVLEGSDGSVNHSVAICQNFIFDSNLCYALKHDKESLDWCCSSDDVAASFVRFHRAVYFYPKNLKKKIYRIPSLFPSKW